MYASVIEKSGKHSTVIVERKFNPDNAHIVLKAVDFVAWKNTQSYHVHKCKIDSIGNVVHTLTVK